MREYHNLDCMDLERGLPSFPDKYFDLIIADPNYGVGEHGGKDRSGYAKQKNGTKIYIPNKIYKKKDWDNKPCRPEILDEIVRVSKHQIIWGINYFDWKPPSVGRIVWDKCNDGSDQSDCELAYCSFHDTVRIFRFMWSGFCQGKSAKEGRVQKGDKTKNQDRFHPTEKPFELYRWILTKYAKAGMKIGDPMAGSAASVQVFEEFGFDYVAYEKDPDYYRDSMARLTKWRSEPRLFTGQEVFEASKQQSLF